MTYKPHLTRYVGQVVGSFPTRNCVITEGWAMRTVDTPPSSRYMSLKKLLDTGGRLAIPGNQTLSDTQDSGATGILNSQGI